MIKNNKFGKMVLLALICSVVMANVNPKAATNIPKSTYFVSINEDENRHAKILGYVVSSILESKILGSINY